MPFEQNSGQGAVTSRGRGDSKYDVEDSDRHNIDRSYMAIGLVAGRDRNRNRDGGARSPATTSNATDVTAAAATDADSDSGESPPTKLYFAYGSNLWQRQMRQRCPNSEYVGIARLRGWQWFIYARGYANINETGQMSLATGDKVYALVYALTEHDERTLDRREGVHARNGPIYSRLMLDCEFWKKPQQQRRIDVRTDPSERKQMLVYVDQNSNGSQRGQANQEYISRMNAGIKDALSRGFPYTYVNTVIRRSIPAPTLGTTNRENRSVYQTRGLWRNLSDAHHANLFEGSKAILARYMHDVNGSVFRPELLKRRHWRRSARHPDRPGASQQTEGAATVVGKIAKRKQQVACMGVALTVPNQEGHAGADNEQPTPNRQSTQPAAKTAPLLNLLNGLRERIPP
ncbi:MAG: hypothetical protein Q9159_003663 [Coniocarpon cinnabarinum]